MEDASKAAVRNIIPSTKVCGSVLCYRLLLFVVGYVWMLTIPSTLHGQRTYIDENALQPGQVRDHAIDLPCIS